jgi:hypothetical protein
VDGEAVYCFGASFAEAMQCLLLGQRARPFLRPDQTRLVLNGEVFTLITLPFINIGNLDCSNHRKRLKRSLLQSASWVRLDGNHSIKSRMRLRNTRHPFALPKPTSAGLLRSTPFISAAVSRPLSNSWTSRHRPSIGMSWEIAQQSHTSHVAQERGFCDVEFKM